MAPVTVAGALTLAHAEALAGLTLAQITRAGAPVIYGSFTSNVDMKSGSPAFGTPEYVKAAFGAGQLARHLGLPWRSSNATAANVPDAQAAYESQMSLWGALMGGCNFILHAAGWMESGLTTSYEKFILDIEMLQMFAEMFQPVGATAADRALDAVAEVGPGGPFLRLRAHHGALPHRILRAAGFRLAQLTAPGTTTARAPRRSAPIRSGMQTLDAFRRAAARSGRDRRARCLRAAAQGRGRRATGDLSAQRVRPDSSL